MIWMDYRERYSTFLRALQQTEMIFRHAGMHFPKGPTKVSLPDKAETPFFLLNSRRILSESSPEWNTDNEFLAMPPIIHLVFDGNTEWVLACHETVMIVAHWEAFAADSLRLIWQQNPTLLADTKTARDHLASFGAASMDSISSEKRSDLIDEAVWQLNRKSPEALIEYLRSKVGITVTVDRRRLVRAALERNIVVHSGGIINDRYLAKLCESEKQGLASGDRIPVDLNYVCELANTVQRFGEQVFEWIAKKVLGIDQPLQDHERIVDRQPPDLPMNPQAEVARMIVRQLGGPDATIDYLRSGLRK